MQAEHAQQLAAVLRVDSVAGHRPRGQGSPPGFDTGRRGPSLTEPAFLVAWSI
jgi:hypothetical protein